MNCGCRPYSRAPSADLCQRKCASKRLSLGRRRAIPPPLPGSAVAALWQGECIGDQHFITGDVR